MRTTIFFLLVIPSVSGLYSCSKSSVNNTPPPVDSVNIYIAGSGISGTTFNAEALLWKNGNPVALSDGSKTEGASAIYVSDNNDYVAGTEFQGTNSFAKYWINNHGFVIGDSTSQATGIAVSGTDIYVSGFEFNMNRSFTIAEYWKNGTVVKLTDGTSDAKANSIVASGNNIYVAGTEGGVATYWLNGSPVRLGGSMATSIMVSGNDVYVAGYQSPSGLGNSSSTAIYWKNGTMFNLSDGTKDAFAYSIFVSGSDAYVAGIESSASTGFYDAKYWKNGQATTLITGTSSGNNANGIFVINSDVYVLGTWAGQNVYWKNNSAIFFSSNPNESGKSLFITKARN